MYVKTKGIFDPKSKDPFKVSRSKIDLFTECPRCFYMDVKLGLSRPPIPTFTLNNAVDNLLKNEFDLLRKKGERHELMEKYAIDAVPFDHPDLPRWRGEVVAYEGATVVHEKSNLLVNGLVDDIWKDSQGNLVIVDYKSTSTTKEISLDDQYKQGYKRQMEVYQWIFKKLGFQVSRTGYFVFANAMKNLPKFDGRLEFAMSIIPYEGTSDWVDLTLLELKQTLMSEDIPMPAPDCEYCAYKQMSIQLVKALKEKQQKLL